MYGAEPGTIDVSTEHGCTVLHSTFITNARFITGPDVFMLTSSANKMFYIFIFLTNKELHLGACRGGSPTELPAQPNYKLRADQTRIITHPSNAKMVP